MTFLFIYRRKFYSASIPGSLSFASLVVACSERKKTYCAAFCASLALLAGSGNNGLQWLERAVDFNKVPEDVARLIYLYFGKQDFFRHFTVKISSLPLPAERISYLYIPCLVYTDVIRKVGLWEKCVFASKCTSCGPWVN